MSDEQPEKRPVGRPTDYDSIYCEMLVHHMADGFSYESFAGKIRCHRSTLYDWEKAHPEFADAKKSGMELCLEWWERQGIEGLHNQTIKDGDGMTVTKSINATLWIFNMKNRFKWRDKQPDEDAPPPSQGSAPAISPAEYAEILRQRQSKKEGN